MKRAPFLHRAALALLARTIQCAHATDPDVVSGLVSYQFLDTLADAPAHANVVSSLVSYQYLDALNALPSQANVISALVSYQYLDSLAGAPTDANIVSPLVSYLYYDWPGDENLTFQTSPTVSYYFNGVPTITVGPASQAVQVGANIALSVQAQGSMPLNYQWRINGIAIPGAVSAILMKSNVQSADSGSYSVVVSNDYGNIVSTAARLNVYLPPATPQPAPPPLITTAWTPPSTLTGAPRTPSSTQLKVFNSSGQVDRNKMTIVLTHGWINKLLPPERRGSDGWPTDMKNALIAKGYDSVANILAWDWRDDALTKSPSTAAARTLNQGDGLGAELFYVLGANYDKPIHFIGHSLGTILNCEAADYLHGDAKNSPAKPSGSSLKYRPENTQMTLFDEAELVQPIKGIHVFIDVLLKPQGDTTADLINNFWTKVIPQQFLWADNYVSEVGLLHPEAVNIMLWRKTYLDPTGPHGYAYQWYQGTVANPLASAMGHRWSSERSSLSSAPNAPGYYVQSLDLTGSDKMLNVISGTLATTLSQKRLVAYPSLKAFQGLNAVGTTVQGVWLDGIEYAGNVVTNVAESFTPLNGEPVYVGTGGSTPAYVEMTETPTSFQANWDFTVTLDKGGTSQPLTARRLMVATGTNASSSTTAPFAIIPVSVPLNAAGMSFEFQFEGADPSSYMTMGIGSENYLTMEARYVVDGVWNHSTVIDIAEFAGQGIEIFVGLNGSGSTGRVNVRGIQFYSQPTPTLGITPVGQQLKLSWPLSAVDWTLETSPTLSLPNSWQAVPTAPVILDYEHSVNVDFATPSQFFRLRKDAPQAPMP